MSSNDLNCGMAVIRRYLIHLNSNCNTSCEKMQKKQIKKCMLHTAYWKVITQQHSSTFQPLCYINEHQAHKFLNMLSQKQTRIVEEH